MERIDQTVKGGRYQTADGRWVNAMGEPLAPPAPPKAAPKTKKTTAKKAAK